MLGPTGWCALEIIGHRANSGRIAVFYSIVGVKAVEVDVSLKSGKPMALHGRPSIRRATPIGRLWGWIDYKLFYRDPLYKPMPLANWLERLWTMGFTKVVIDVKSGGLDPTLLAGEVERGWPGQVIYTSENHRYLRRLRDEASAVVYTTYSILPVDVADPALKAGAEGVSIRFDLAIEDNVVRTLRQSGLKVVVWTVNTEDQAKTVEKLGVDAIVSDRPDTVLRALDKGKK
ncbi:hypothetical protein apy_00930 [Aeropyrum pernix]|uniref:GP-PDE domain-containing protein n=1 Tax=Aeropyrum pernix TaxID=56636 RepID=A0A401H7L5_AERPX|nr:hypothetical protein apy_00930 [Aeropyrum pernix]